MKCILFSGLLGWYINFKCLDTWAEGLHFSLASNLGVRLVELRRPPTALDAEGEGHRDSRMKPGVPVPRAVLPVISDTSNTSPHAPSSAHLQVSPTGRQVALPLCYPLVPDKPRPPPPNVFLLLLRALCFPCVGNRRGGPILMYYVRKAKTTCKWFQAH